MNLPEFFRPEPLGPGASDCGIVAVFVVVDLLILLFTDGPRDVAVLMGAGVGLDARVRLSRFLAVCQRKGPRRSRGPV